MLSLSAEAQQILNGGTAFTVLVLLFKAILDWLGKRRAGNQGADAARAKQLSTDTMALLAQFKAAVTSAEASARAAREDREACERERSGLYGEIGALRGRVAQLEQALATAGIPIPAPLGPPVKPATSRRKLT